jgi:hypothetical protein
MLKKILDKLGIKIELLSTEDAARDLLKKEVTFEFRPEIIDWNDSDRSVQLHHCIAPHWMPEQRIH